MTLSIIAPSQRTNRTAAQKYGEAAQNDELGELDKECADALTEEQRAKAMERWLKKIATPRRPRNSKTATKSKVDIREATPDGSTPLEKDMTPEHNEEDDCSSEEDSGLEEGEVEFYKKKGFSAPDAKKKTKIIEDPYVAEKKKIIDKCLGGEGKES